MPDFLQVPQLLTDTPRESLHYGWIWCKNAPENQYWCQELEMITSSICLQIVNLTVTCLTQGIFTGYVSMIQQKGRIAFTCQNNYFCHFMLYTRLTYLLLNRLVVKTSIKLVLAVHSVWPTCLRGSEQLKVSIFKSAFFWSMKKKFLEIEESL